MMIFLLRSDKLWSMSGQNVTWLDLRHCFISSVSVGSSHELCDCMLHFGYSPNLLAHRWRNAETCECVNEQCSKYLNDSDDDPFLPILTSGKVTEDKIGRYGDSLTDDVVDAFLAILTNGNVNGE